MRIKIAVNHPKKVTVHETVLDAGHVEEIRWGWEFANNSLSFTGFVTDRAGKSEWYLDKILTKDFLTRLLDVYYFVGNDDDYVVYSDSDGLKEVTILYSSDVLYDIFVDKIDVAQMINYLRDNYNFFYDPNRKELEDDVKGLSLKVEELEEACRRKDHILSEQTKRLNKHVNLRLSILQVYREIFDCSNGDPEGTDMENLQDILTEYKRVLKMKDDAETDKVKWRPYIAEILGMDKGSDWSDICIRARMIKNDKDNISSVLKLLQNDIRGAYTEVFPADANYKHWLAYDRQAVTDITEELKRERALKETAEEKAVQWKTSYQDLKKEVLDTYETLYSDDFQPGDPMKALEIISDYIPLRSKAVCKGLNEEFERANKLEQKLMAVYDALGIVPKEDI